MHMIPADGHVSDNLLKDKPGVLNTMERFNLHSDRIASHFQVIDRNLKIT